jgi:hypothetical protein
MIQENSAVDLPESRRKVLFRLLVVAHDYAMSVAEAREMACDLFGLAETQVAQIEQGGLDSDWPPLCRFLVRGIILPCSRMHVAAGARTAPFAILIVERILGTGRALAAAP